MSLTKKAVVCLLGLGLTAAPVAAQDPAAEQEAKSQQQEAVPEAAQPAPAPAAKKAAARPAEEAPSPGSEAVLMDEITITVTREARPTRDVPQAIAVIGKERMADSVVFNVKDAVAGTPGVLIESKNGGYDARLLIRGAGLKASYGVREIMVLRDGVPLTDPDSFTRLDWIDTNDMERIEISRGPGNLYSPGSAGGAIQIISRSVFDRGADVAKASFGSWGAGNVHLRTSGRVNASNALALSASYRTQENDWRTWNQFDTRQVGVKHGLSLGDDGTLESELSYSEADLQLAGGMNDALFAEFERTGRQRETSEPWKHSGRYSKILFANTKLEQEVGAFLLKPRLYFNQWRHTHPVTGSINVSGDWTRNLGTDLEAQHRHQLGPVAGTLVFGLTAKGSWNPDVRRYQYRDVQIVNGRIVATRSDARGELMETEDQRTILGGAFVQESLRWERLLLDVGFRYDRSRMYVLSDETTAYDYSAGNYVAGAGRTETDKSFDLPAPKVGLTFRVTDALNLWASAAQAYQVPSESEVMANNDLEPSRSTSYEVGVKARAARFALDASVYYNRVEDEIVSFRVDGETVFQNAGETEKRGFEASGSVRALPWLEVGGSYAYSDYEYVHFVERAGATTADRSGNRLPYIPRHQYSVFASAHHAASGLRGRVQSSTWGRYEMDNANSQTWRGYSWLTSVSAAWQRGAHEVLFEVENLLDDAYATQVTKDTSGRITYSGGAPRAVTFGYGYRM